MATGPSAIYPPSEDPNNDKLMDNPESIPVSYDQKFLFPRILQFLLKLSEILIFFLFCSRMVIFSLMDTALMRIEYH